MKKIILIIVLCFAFGFSKNANAQTVKIISQDDAALIVCDTMYENIGAKKIAGDSTQSTFIVWFKKGMSTCYHKTKQENIVVLDGEADFVINGIPIHIKKGDIINIPIRTLYSFTVTSYTPLKIVSVQTVNLYSDITKLN